MTTVHTFPFNPYQENTYILVDNATNKGVIIDPGCSNYEETNELANFIAKHNIQPVLLLNTHCHLDHILGNKFLFEKYGLKPLYHQADQILLDKAPVYAHMMGFTYELSPSAERYLVHNEEITFGETKLKCLHTPGHSKGSISFYNSACDFIVSGDVLFWQSVGRTDLEGGDFEELKESIINHLLTLPDEVIVYSGHGRPTSIGFERLHNPYLAQ
jgi:hydroxyacylglutathione hydrolase